MINLANIGLLAYLITEIFVHIHLGGGNTTLKETHNQKFLNFDTILNQFLVQFYPGIESKEKKLPPLQGPKELKMKMSNFELK